MMSETAEKTDPALWETVKHEVTEGDKGGKPGQWSARKAQLAVNAYKHRGGGYVGVKPDPDNSLAQWGREDWGTKSGEPSGRTGERYLPKAARDHLSDAEYQRSTDKKRADIVKGEQHSAQPADVAKKTARYRDGHGAHGEKTRADLYAQAKKRGIKGASKMKKAELEAALA